LVDGVEVARAPNFDDTVSHPGRPEHRAFSALTESLSEGSHVVSAEVFTPNGTGVSLENGLLKITSL
jgi:hypothetical protein